MLQATQDIVHLQYDHQLLYMISPVHAHPLDRALQAMDDDEIDAVVTGCTVL
jgi:hypothetical protein